MGDPLWLFMLLWLTLLAQSTTTVLSFSCSQILCICLSLYFTGLISNTLLVWKVPHLEKRSFFSIKFSKINYLNFSCDNLRDYGREKYSISKFSSTSFHKAQRSMLWHAGYKKRKIYVGSPSHIFSYYYEVRKL